ncbi:MAG: hypothetical protein WDZ86_07095 [Gammaproteobacteria bacterium]
MAKALDFSLKQAVGMATAIGTKAAIATAFFTMIPVYYQIIRYLAEVTCVLQAAARSRYIAAQKIACKLRFCRIIRQQLPAA